MSSPAMQIRSRIPRIAESAVQRARLTVVPRRRTATSRMPFLVLVSMVLLGGVVGLLLFNTSMQQASFTSTALEQQATRLAARQQTLQMDLDRLNDPQHVARSAQRLGMVQACSPAFLRLGSGKVTGAPCTDSTQLRINPRAPGKPAVLTPRTKVVYVDPPAPPAGSATTTGGTATAAGTPSATNSTGDTASGTAGQTGGAGRKNQ